MRSPTAAILWEIWARNRWALIFAFALLPLAAVLYGLANWLQPLQTFGENAGPVWVIACIFSFLGVLLSLAALFWSFSFTAMDERGRFAGFPLRLFTLPIRTRHAVAVPLFSGLVTIVTAYLAWFFFITRVLMGPRLPATETVPGSLEIAWQVLVIASGYVTMQVLIWLLYPVRHLRMAIISLVPVGFWLLWLWVPQMEFHDHPARWFFALSTWFVIAIAAAFKVVEWDRQGGWQGAQRWVFARRHAVANRKFSSPARAQFWFEWRRKGWFGAVLLGVIMGLALLLWPVPLYLETQLQFGAAGYPPRPVELLTFWLWPISALSVTAVLSAGFAKTDFWMSEIGLPGFHASRPVSSSDLVMAKFRVGAATTLLAWCVFLLFIAYICFTAWMNMFWWSFAEIHPALWKWLSNPLVLVSFALVHWHKFVGGMKETISGRIKAITLDAWCKMGLLSLVFGVVVWCYSHPQDLELWLLFLPGITVALVMWKVASMVKSFRLAWRLLSMRQQRTLVRIWLGIVTSVVFSAFLAQRLHAMPPEIIWFFAAWFMPAGEMADCVSKFASNRHR
jgi:hypothetical protein